MTEFVEAKNDQLINVAHIVSAELRDDEWCLKLSDGNFAFCSKESLLSVRDISEAASRVTSSAR